MTSRQCLPSLILALAAAGCSSEVNSNRAASAPSKGSQRLGIGGPCPQTAVAPTGSAADPPQAYVEMALLHYPREKSVRVTPAAAGSEPRWLDDPRVTIAWSTNLLVTNEKPATTRIAPIGTSKPCPIGSERDLTVISRWQPLHPDHVWLDVSLHRGTPSAMQTDGCPKVPLVRASIVVSNQRTVFLATHDTQGSVLAVTPYLIRGEAELDQLLICKNSERPPNPRE